jgi:surface-anchored protein
MRLLTTLGSAAAALVLTATALPAHAAVITSGHVDLLDVDWTASATTLDIKTYSPANDDTSPASTTVEIPSTSTTVLPSGSAWNCLGAGSTVYIAPATNTADVPWLGLDTEDVPASAGPVSLQLVSWSVPTGAKFALYQTSLGNPLIRFNTNAVTDCTKQSYSMAAGAHAHGNWIFSTTGTYSLTFKATTADGHTSGNVTYTIQVG